MIHGKKVFTTGDVAKICNVASRTVSKWFDSGHLKGYRIPGSNDRRIPVNELVRFMKDNGIPPTDFNISFGTIRVLIADSNAEKIEAVAKELGKKKEYEIQLAQSNFEIGTAIQKFLPHVVLINVESSKLDSVNICQNISENEELQTIKVIAISNKATKQKINNLLKKGFDNVITDSDNSDQFIEKIEQSIAIIY